MVIATAEVHQSRWGYHPCSYEQYLYLKNAHKLLLRAHRDLRRWITWKRKTVYRSKKEPVFCPMLSHDLYNRVLKAYQNARHPVCLEDVEKIDLPDYLIDQIKLVEAFYASTELQSQST